MSKTIQPLSTLLDAVTATTTSEAMNIAGAKKVTLELTRANHSSGSSAFSVTVSIDGTNFFDFNGMLQDLANSNAQMPVRAASVTLSSNTTEYISLDLTYHSFKAIKVKVTETTDGTHTCKVLAEYEV